MGRDNIKFATLAGTHVGQGGSAASLLQGVHDLLGGGLGAQGPSARVTARLGTGLVATMQVWGWTWSLLDRRKQ